MKTRKNVLKIFFFANTSSLGAARRAPQKLCVNLHWRAFSLLFRFTSLKFFWGNFNLLLSCCAVSGTSQWVPVALNGLAHWDETLKEKNWMLFIQQMLPPLVARKQTHTWNHSHTLRLPTHCPILISRSPLYCTYSHTWIHPFFQPPLSAVFPICKHFKLIWIKLFNTLNLLLV